MTLKKLKLFLNFRFIWLGNLQLVHRRKSVFLNENIPWSLLPGTAESLSSPSYTPGLQDNIKSVS